MPYILALVTFALCIFVYTCASWTIRNPETPVWPPRNWSWTARIITWSVTIAAIGSAYQAGMTSWNEWNLPGWLRWGVGFPICFTISTLSSVAIVQMGLDQAMGANNALKTDKLFAWSRNPTYVGNIGLCFGFVILAASTPALIAAASLAVLYVAVIPLEEKWLEHTYGDEYRTYKSQTPRWFSVGKQTAVSKA
ncbi:MAG: methyltransferase [Pseudomonadota bacterium]